MPSTLRYQYKAAN